MSRVSISHAMYASPLSSNSQCTTEKFTSKLKTALAMDKHSLVAELANSQCTTNLFTSKKKTALAMGKHSLVAELEEMVLPISAKREKRDAMRKRESNGKTKT